MRTYETEADVKADFIKKRTDECVWSSDVLRYKNEKKLLDNWTNILYNNNKDIDKLNNVPLSKGKKGQLLELITNNTPAKLNRFINNKIVKLDLSDEKVKK